MNDIAMAPVELMKALTGSYGPMGMFVGIIVIGVFIVILNGKKNQP